MDDIDDRAKQYAARFKTPELETAAKYGYKNGAEEQDNLTYHEMYDKSMSAFKDFLQYLYESDRITLDELEDEDWIDAFKKKISHQLI